MTTLSVSVLFTGTCRSTITWRKSTVAFPWQKWLRERPTVLRYTYVAYLFGIVSASACLPFQKATLNRDEYGELVELYRQGKPDVWQKSDSIIIMSEYSQFLLHRGHCAFGISWSCLMIFRESSAIVFESYTEHMIHCVQIKCIYFSIYTWAVKVIFDYNLCI
jgi:hypothetical protein